MSHLMKLAEALRDIAEECDRGEIEEALGLCGGFADRVRKDAEFEPEFSDSQWQLVASKCPRLPN